MKPLATRILVTSADAGHPLALIDAVHSYYEALTDGLAPDEIDPRCRQVGELALLDVAIQDNGFRSYIDRHTWRAQAAQDIVAALESAEASAEAQIVAAIAEKLNALSADQMSGVLHGLPSERGDQGPDLRALNEWLDEQVDLFSETLTEKVIAVAERLRRKGVIKTVSSDRQIDVKLERILARSPTHRAKQRAIADRQERDRPYTLRRHQAIEELGRLAGLSVYLDAYRLAQNEFAWAPRCWVLSLRTADGRPDYTVPMVCYFEDGDKGVLARSTDGVRLAEVGIEPGSTDLVE